MNSTIEKQLKSMLAFAQLTQNGLCDRRVVYIMMLYVRLYNDYSSTVVGHICAMWQTNLFRINANNANCMFNSGCGHIFNCSEFILHIYTDRVVSYLYMNYLEYVAFQEHICCWHIYMAIAL